MKRSEGASEPPKVVRTPSVFNILTSKCAPRHNGVHFSTSQLPRVVRTWFCTFWLGNVLRATTACAFSTSPLPKVVRTWCVLYILTWKCASRHNGVQFFFSHLASWLRTALWRAYFSTPRTFKSLEKHSVLRLSCLFAHLRLLSSDSFSSLIFSRLLFSSLLWLLPPLLFHLSILSEVWFRNFLRETQWYLQRNTSWSNLASKNLKNAVNPMRFTTWWAAFWTSHWLRARSARTFGWCFTMQNCSFENWKRRPSSELIWFARMFKEVEPRRTFWKTLGAPMPEKKTVPQMILAAKTIYHYSIHHCLITHFFQFLSMLFMYTYDVFTILYVHTCHQSRRVSIKLWHFFEPILDQNCPDLKPAWIDIHK